MKSGSVLADEHAVFEAPAHLPTDTRGKARVDDRRVISGDADRRPGTSAACPST